MKTSFCSIAIRDQSIRHIIPQVADAGYDGIEIWGTHLESYLEKEGTLPELKKILDGNKLETACIEPMFNLTGSPAEAKESVRLGKRYIKFSEALGKPPIRVFTGGKGSDQASDDEWKQCADALQELCDEAAPKGICFALETHPNNLMDTPEGTYKLLDMVNYPNLRVIFDAWHVFCEGKTDPVACLDEMYQYIIHVHAKNRKQKAKGPRGTNTRHLDEGDLDWPPLLQALKGRRYRGFVSIEWFGIDRTTVWDTAERELAYLKQYV